MIPQEEQYTDSMISGSSQQPSWDSSRAYQSSRLSPTQAYRGYTFEQPPQVTQATMYNTDAGSNGMTSAQHQAHSYPPPSWSGVYSHSHSHGDPTQTRNESDSPSTLLAPTTAPRVPSISGSLRTPRVGPRKTLTDEDRREICLYHRQHPDKKQTEIGEVFGVERSTISKILRHKEKFLGEEGGPATRLFGQIEQQLFLWGAERERSGQQLSLEMLKRQARVLATTRRVDVLAMAELEKPSFLEGFIQRNPGLTSFSYLRAQQTSSDRPLMHTSTGSYTRTPSYAAHYTNDIPNRLDTTGSFALPSPTSSFPNTRETFTPSNPSAAIATYDIMDHGFGYAPTTSSSRSNPFSPLSTDSSASANWNSTRSRNYILSSTNPDPAGSPPLLGRSPGLRDFELTNTSHDTMPSTSTNPASQTFSSSYTSSQGVPNGLVNLSNVNNTSQLPIINRTWSESQVPLQHQTPGLPQQMNKSSPTSTTISSATNSVSPGGNSLCLQQPASSLPEDEDRALAALTSIQANGGLEGESIRDMTVGRLMERLSAGSRARSHDGRVQECETGLRSLRRAGPDGDGAEVKRHRMQ